MGAPSLSSGQDQGQGGGVVWQGMYLLTALFFPGVLAPSTCKRNPEHLHQSLQKIQVLGTTTTLDGAHRIVFRESRPQTASSLQARQEGVRTPIYSQLLGPLNPVESPLPTQAPTANTKQQPHALGMRREVSN